MLIASVKSSGELAGLTARVNELLLFLEDRPVVDGVAGGSPPMGSGSALRNWCSWYAGCVSIVARFSGKGTLFADMDAPDGLSAHSYRLLPAALVDDGSNCTGGLELAEKGAWHDAGHYDPRSQPAPLPTGGPRGPDILLQIKNLDVVTAGGPLSQRRLVHALCLQVRRGMRLLVTGPSGCGKSTLLREISAAARRQFEEASPQPVSQLVYLGVPLAQFTVCPQTPYFFPVRAIKPD